MKTFRLLTFLLAVFVFVSCGQKKDASQEESTEPANDEATVNEDETAETQEPEEVEITTELYCNVYKDVNKMKMEKYWEKFKDKEYEEVKDLYEEYLKEEHDILNRYGLEDFDELQSYYRNHFNEVDEYRANDPDYVEYPEYQEVKFKLADFAGARANEKTDELIDQVK